MTTSLDCLDPTSLYYLRVAPSIDSLVYSLATCIACVDLVMRRVKTSNRSSSERMKRVETAPHPYFPPQPHLQQLATMTDMDVEMADGGFPTTTASNGKGKAREGGLAALKMEDVLPWVELYRPVTLADVVAHQDIITTSSSPAPDASGARTDRTTQLTSSSRRTACRTCSSTGPQARARRPPSSPSRAKSTAPRTRLR